MSILPFGIIGGGGGGGGGQQDLSGLLPAGLATLVASTITETIDLTNLSDVYVQLDTNWSPAFAFPSAPRDIVLRLKQDGTGGRTITWPVNWDWGRGYPPVVDRRPNAETWLVVGSSDGGISVQADGGLIPRDLWWTFTPTTADLVVVDFGSPIPVYDPCRVLFTHMVGLTAPGGQIVRGDLLWTPNLVTSTGASLFTTNTKPHMPVASRVGPLTIPNTVDCYPDTGAICGAFIGQIEQVGSAPNYGKGATLYARVLPLR